LSLYPTPCVCLGSVFVGLLEMFSFKTSRFLYPVLVVIATVCVPANAGTQVSGYIPLMRSAISKAASGQTRESFALLAQAADYDADDPLTQTLLGYLDSIGGRPESAKADYEAALKKDPSCGYAAYGLGLLALNSTKPEAALEALAKAQGLNPNLNMRGTLEYVKFICTGNAKEFTDPDDPILDVIQAYGYMNLGKSEEALAMLEQSLKRTSQYTYKEMPGMSASFLASKPVTASAWQLRKTDVLRSFKERKIQVVSDILTLKADMRRANTVKMVSFLIDGRVVCITNQEPFSYDWNTRKIADGLHTVTIQGDNEATTMITSKTVRVFVCNQHSGTAALVDPKGYIGAWQELWNAMRLKPSVCAINYGIAICALNLGKNDRAQEALENVISINPGFRDAKDRLIKLRGGGRDDVKVYKSRGGLNRVALTFDDGPKPAVTGVLDILRQNGIHGTFFVVGKQVETFPELLKSIHKDGNEIQNHTFHHYALSYLKESEIEKEYFSTSCAVRNLIGTGTTCVRPPGGRSGTEYYRFLRQYGVQSILWTINCVSREGTNKNKLTSYVINQIRPGSIILMHYEDMVAQQALPEIISGLKARRYEFVTVSELLNQ